MRNESRLWQPMLTAVALIVAAGTIMAQQPVATLSKSPAATATPYASPVRLKAGSKMMGAKRLYPSPTFQDVNGDQLPDIVIGDLVGKVTVALRDASDSDGISFKPETPILNDQGKALKFHNW